MKHWRVIFWNVRTGEKQYREYPQIGQFDTRKSLCNFLINRKFLTDYIVDSIEEFNPLEEKMKMANAWGQLIYGLNK